MTKRRSTPPRAGDLATNRAAQRARRGRPPATRPRKATRVYLSKRQHERWITLTTALGQLGAARIDVADLVIAVLDDTLDELQSGLTGNDQVLPVGVVDLKSLFFLLDLKPPEGATTQYTITMLTETREKMSVMTIRLQSTFRDQPGNAKRVTWSQVFGLGVELLYQRLSTRHRPLGIVEEETSLEDLKQRLFKPQQLTFNIR